MKKIILCLLTIILLLTGCSKTETGVKETKPSEIIYWGINDDILYLSPTFQGYATNENTSLLHSNDWTDIPWYYKDGKFDWYIETGIKRVEILKDGSNTIVPESTAYWFIALTDCLEIEGLENLDTRFVSNMDSMFCNLVSIKELNASFLNTSNVVNMNEMFFGIKLTSLDLSSFDTSNVTNMSHMFEHCWELTNINLSSFDTSNVTDMTSMFDNCFSLESIDVSNFNTSNVEHFSGMFNNTKLTKENTDLSNFDISKAADISNTDDLFGFHF